ncbi:NADH-quinone oxidoreductase subunit H [Candidatus Hakubella thermalkaliphila]|uniref:NADH-quinone oxidoreductase subunit H n=2 Tax=Candidatus Hakubella thermalkaliphila TaxID=2754717 RepID=A0A6V8Q247_9ACTN|nr:NADH-quinone oxidoreductase subunit NuoH [Candidatus Hakubella thermalkaliphila]MBT9171210.1 NADH-quinone oxidoreductase subunit H [Actinomycetota bacterium]GFP21202.1 NADH-quinone oxidoreductase subunit H [Candidatus Hakubella thermalkaliphila]GFP23116.1 NADH-quinone oxidoreductase subunit H [Candidatus Hakubella thermalkaliphila]GFP30187.1 NADH-quinone oxidoreductase subunit H [Candidatus Hakubella thermalkaliphila]GFP37060.1 NADH-quinone oxidoreductase subunit H [Candidatus Hakubella the
MSLLQTILVIIIELAAALGFIMVTALILIYMLRKVMGHMQARLGPIRVGPHGVLQTVADALKLFGKEDIIPAAADKWTFRIAPAIVFTASLATFSFIPFAPNIVAVNVDISLFFLLAISSLAVLGIVMAGWGSNNKYALLGGLRGVAQMISYEIPLVLSTLGVVMMTGSLNLIDIVEKQKTMYNIVPQFLGFAIFIVAALAKINRTPFDLPEAESELVAGYNTEYSGMRWAFFFLAEFVNIFIISALGTIVFLGGWNGFLISLPPWAWFMIKSYVLIFFVMWVWSTFPRFRADQLMDVGWKILLPLALLNIALTGLVILLREGRIF